MSLIKAAGAGEQSTGFYKHLLDQSLKFNDADSPYLHRTPASQGSLTTFTFSFWYKRSKLGTYQEVLHVYPGSGERSQILFMNNDTLKVELEAGNTNHFLTNMLFRDTSAWYHVVVTFDSTNGTQANRVKIYVNGVDQSGTGGGGFSTANYPSQNATSGFNTTTQHEISTYDGSDYHLDGYLAEVNFIDGTALTAASFGETKDGIWIPKDTSGLTFGTNGFHLTFKDDVVSEGFNTVTWRGTGASNSVSGIGFSPAFVWIKDRTDATVHYLHDVCRGAGKEWYSNGSYTEYSDAQTLKSFDGDGFTVGTSTGVNGSADDVVAWCWEGGGAPTADNSASAGATPTANSVKIDGSNLGSALAGSIAATRLTADTTKGFSAVTYTGTGSAGTVAHGLGAAPKWIIVKRLNATDMALVYHTSRGASAYLYLGNNGSGETGVSYPWNGTDPTTSVFSVNSAASVSSAPYIAYCWAEVSGYSKFGSFTGNGGSQAIDVGFKPAFVMLRRTNGGTWGMFDNTRQSQSLQMIGANSTAAETTNSGMTFSGNTFNDNGYLSDNGTTVLYMAFADTREAAFFKDVSTNGNHFTPVNLDYRDSVPDTPTNNWCTLNPALSDSHFNTDQLSEGNLFYNEGEGNDGDGHPTATFSVTSGKWYWEAQVPSQQNSRAIGFTRTDNIGKGNVTLHGNGFTSANSVVGIDLTDDTIDQVDKAGTHTQHASGLTGVANNDIFGFSVDLDGGTFQMYRNGSAYGSSYNLDDLADWQTHGMTPTASGKTYMAYRFNFGQDSSFAGRVATANSNADGNGHGSFAYAPPSGYLALCSQNLPDVAIIDATDNFNTVLWTGNGSDGRSITGVGFDPDFVWIRSRNLATSHLLNDTIRGANKTLFSEGTTAETADNGGGYLSAFVTDGFSVTSGGSGDDAVNDSSDTYVAWNWLAGTAFSNDASATSVGTIDSSGQVNATAGFSIVSYTGTGSNGTISHGLSTAPELVIVKERSGTGQWSVQSTSLSAATKVLHLQSTAAEATKADHFNSTFPTSTVFSVGTSGNTNGNTNTFIAYCFHSVEGYSKIGTYEGNGNNDGTFVYTGFRPAFLLVKSVDSTSDWLLVDDKRIGYNPDNEYIEVNNANAEGTVNMFDLVSNGFKNRDRTADPNVAETYLYIAFASQPFKFANAR